MGWEMVWVNVCDVVRVLLEKIGYLSLLNRASDDFGVCGLGEWGWMDRDEMRKEPSFA